MIQRLFQTVILLGHMAHRRVFVRIEFDLMEDIREIQSAGLPVRNRFGLIQQINPAYHFVIAAQTELRHDLTHLFCHEEEIIHNVFRFAGKLGAQYRVLRSNADRAGIEMTLAHHDATFHHQRRCRKTDFIGAQQGSDSHVATGFHLSVSLNPHPATQSVQYQSLLGFRQAQLPGRAGMLDRRHRRSACAAVVAGNHQMICLSLADAGGNGAHTDTRNQLD